MISLKKDSEKVQIVGALSSSFREIVSPEAMHFLVHLHETFECRRQALLTSRIARQIKLDNGEFPTFLKDTQYIRDGEWKVASIPNDLLDRRVEITGPVDRKMVINALNSGAKCYMADFEDSTAPTWFNQVDGQINLKDAVRKTIDFKHPTTGKSYALKKKVATLLVRPRGWHLDEAHVFINGQKVSGSLFDFSMYFFHNVVELLTRNSAPYFYLPKLESHLEAKLWNDVFIASQRYMGVPTGSIRATVLIETILAVFEMDEILYELREHSAGLNCGRWDYIFSYIKKFRNHAAYVIPDRSQVSMGSPFMANYVKLLIETCHKRGAFAMGGMAASIPVKNNPALNEKVMDAVKQDKIVEVLAGHDGTWVAHPALVKLAQDVFDQHMPEANQIEKKANCTDIITAEMLVVPPKGTITPEGLEENIDVSLMYMEAWLRGQGCIPLNNKMEDAATAEISRGQVWQWIRHGCKMTDGKKVSKEMVKSILDSCVSSRSKDASSSKTNNRFTLAGTILEEILLGDEFVDFLTLPCYPHIVSRIDESSRL